MRDEWTPEEEAQRLHRRFDDLKATQGIGQAEFARRHGIAGGASMVSQHIKGRRPINLDAAIAYASGFGVSLGEISPRLAREVDRAHVVISHSDDMVSARMAKKLLEHASEAGLLQETRWPFSRIDYDKFVCLKGVDARNIENAILAAAGDLDIDVRVARSGKSKAA